MCFAEFSFKIPVVLKLNTKNGMQLGLSLVHHYEFCYSNYIGFQSIQVRQQREAILIFSVRRVPKFHKKATHQRVKGGCLRLSLRFFQHVDSEALCSAAWDMHLSSAPKPTFRTTIGTGFRAFLSFKRSG